MKAGYKRLMPLVPVGVIVIAGASFIGGMQVQKRIGASTNQSTTANGSGAAGRQAAGGFGGGMRQGGRPVFGTVASIDGSTLKVTDSMSSGTTIVTVSSATKITDDDGTAKAVADIATGDTVMVIGTAGSDGVVAATQVRLNPSQTGPMGAAAPGAGFGTGGGASATTGGI